MYRGHTRLLSIDPLRRRRPPRFRKIALTAALMGAIVPGITFGLPTASAACSGTLIDSATLTLPGLETAVGAPSAWALGLSGAGVDIALIDTGIDAVGGLASSGKVVDAVDLSFDAPFSNLRYRDVYVHTG